MATATWFDYTAYMANKLAQVNAIAGGKQYTAEEFKVEFEKAGYVGEEGAFKHFQEYGDKENVAPNALFNADEYVAAKAAREFKTDKPTATQIADVKKAFADGGMTAWDHYVAFGSNEGVEPSYSFNADAYLAAKVAALNTGKYDGKSDWKVEDVAAAIKASGITVLEHFMGNGGDGKFEVAVSYKGVTEGGVKNPFIDNNPPVPVPDPNPGETFTLGTGTNKIVGTEKDDIVNGLASGLGSENTLHAKDTIDGGLGTDTLNLTMKSSFGGFDVKEGFMKSVEVVNLTNTSSSEKTFNASNVSDVLEYNIDATKGGIKLTNLADTKAAISLKGQQKGDFSIGYADKVTDGTDDSLSLTVDGVGKQAVGTTAASVVTVKTAGVENVAVTAKGANVIGFAADSGIKTLEVKGTGDLTVDSVSKALTGVDANAASGKMNIDVRGATQVKDVALGGNDDVLTANAGRLLATAVISGGNGNDTLVLDSSAAANLALNMDSVETLSLGDITGALTFSAKNASGLTTIEVTTDVAEDVAVARLGDVDMNINLTGANGTAAKSITADNTGATKVSVSSSEKEHTVAARGENEYNVVLSKSNAVELTVAGNMNYTGAVTASAADSFSLTAEGILGGELTLNKATKADMTFTGNTTSAVTIDAVKLETLDITTAKDLTLTGGNTTAASNSLMSLQQLTVETDGAFDGSGFALGKLSSANLSGDGSVTLSTLGSATLEDYGITVTASGLAKGLTLGTVTTKGTDILIDAKGMDGKLTLGGAINATAAGNVEVHVGQAVAAMSSGITGKKIIFDASEVISGATTYGSMNAQESLTFTGSDTLANGVTGVATGTSGSVEMSFTGGMADDKFTVTNHSDFDGKIDISAVGNGGVDVLTLNGVATHGLTVNSLNLTDVDVITSGTVDFSDMKSGVTIATTGGTVTGTSLADNFTMAASGGTVTGGAGKDIITCGAGVDTICLTSSNKEDADIIVNFKSAGADIIHIDSASDGAFGGMSATHTVAKTLSDVSQFNLDKMNVIASDGPALDNASALLAQSAISGAFNATGKQGGITAVGSDGNWYIWYIDNKDAADLELSDITLIGTISKEGLGAAGVVAADFSFT